MNGEPVAYLILQEGIPVVASDGETVGTVHHVVAEPGEDIFHGLVISTGSLSRRFVEAADVAALYEDGVELSIDSAAAGALPEPGGGAPAYTENPAEQGGWAHLARKLTFRSDWHRRS